MIVALQNQIHLVFIENWLPRISQISVVSILGGRKDRVMEDADHPFRAIVRQDFIQPARLDVDFFVAIQTNQTDVVINKRIATFFQPPGTVFGQCELGSPMMG